MCPNLKMLQQSRNLQLVRDQPFATEDQKKRWVAFPKVLQKRA